MCEYEAFICSVNIIGVKDRCEYTDECVWGVNMVNTRC